MTCFFRCEVLTDEETAERFPQFHNPSQGNLIHYFPDAGVVDAILANAVHIQLARAHGAIIHEQCPVTNVEVQQDGRVKVS